MTSARGTRQRSTPPRHLAKIAHVRAVCGMATQLDDPLADALLGIRAKNPSPLMLAEQHSNLPRQWAPACPTARAVGTTAALFVERWRRVCCFSVLPRTRFPDHTAGSPGSSRCRLFRVFGQVVHEPDADVLHVCLRRARATQLVVSCSDRATMPPSYSPRPAG